MLRRYKALLLFIPAMLLLVFLSFFVKRWLMQDTWLMEGYPLFDWIHDAGRSYVMMLDDENHKQYMLGLLFPLLFTAMILSVFNIGFIAVYILLRRWLSIRNLSYSDQMREKIDNALLEYLYGDKDTARLKMENLNRRILVREIVGLQKQIVGSKSEQLRGLFYDLHLDQFVIQKIKSSRWFNKIMYIDAAQWMLVNQAVEVIRPYQYVSNIYLRNVAQVACVNLDTGDSFTFLNVLEYPLPVWHHVILHKTMVRNSIPLPDFYSFLQSDNSTVIIFALNMIRLFSQEGSEDEIIKLVTHEDPVVRRNALRVVRDLKIYKAIETIKQHFHNETLRNQVGMVHALTLEKPKETFEFYKGIWIETPYKVQVEILKHVAPVLRKRLIFELPQEHVSSLIIND